MTSKTRQRHSIIWGTWMTGNIIANSNNLVDGR